MQLSHVAAAAAAQIAATSTAAAASLSSPARRPLDAAAPSPIGAPSPASSTASVHSVTMSRTHRRPKSRQLFGDAAWVEAAAADQGGRPPNADDRQQSTHARPASTASDIVVGRKKRSLKDAHAVTALVQPVASEAGPPSADALLFSSATYTSRDPLAQQAALVANTTLRPNTASSVQLSPTSHPAQSRSDAAGGDETEDDDLTAEDGEDDPDEYTMGDDDDDSTDGGESIDMKDGVSVAESKRSTGIHVNMTQPPFTFDPLNHRPWIAAFMDRHTLPLGTGTNSHTSATHAPSTLAHALRSHAFRVACQAHYAYTPLESWFFRGFDGSSSDASLVGMRFGTPDGFHRLLAERIGVAPEELPERMTRREWNVARRLIGCPRRISSAFLREERTRLHQAQQAAHQRQLSQLATGDATTSTNRHQTAPGSITDESSCPSFLAPGTRVFAPHPRGQLAPAVVLETRTNASADSVAYLVRFHDQARGATSVVPDNAIVLSSATVPTRAAQTAAQLLQLELLRASATAPGSGSGSSSARAHAPPFLHAESDRVLLARLLQLVDRKQVLLAELRRQNDTMATMRAQPANATTASNSTLYNTDTSSCVSVASVGEETAMEVDSAIASHPTHIGTDAGAHSITSASSPPLAPAASPAIALTPAQFATAYQLFQRQYAWVVLQLEATSQNLEATLTQLRLRVKHKKSIGGARDGWGGAESRVQL